MSLTAKMRVLSKAFSLQINDHEFWSILESGAPFGPKNVVIWFSGCPTCGWRTNNSETRTVLKAFPWKEPSVFRTGCVSVFCCKFQFIAFSGITSLLANSIYMAAYPPHDVSIHITDLKPVHEWTCWRLSLPLHPWWGWQFSEYIWCYRITLRSPVNGVFSVKISSRGIHESQPMQMVWGCFPFKPSTWSADLSIDGHFGKKNRHGFFLLVLQNKRHSRRNPLCWRIIDFQM